MLLLIFLMGASLRFWKLDWGDTHLFHPDEYNLGLASQRLKFPDQMNPQFFAYGSFTVYLIYFTQQLMNVVVGKSSDPLLESILIGRFYSAFFSTLTIFLIFSLTSLLFKNKLISSLSTVLVAFTPGLIQQAHFTTPESLLTFWLFALLLLLALAQEKKQKKFLYLGAISLGFALATKIVALVFIPLHLLTTASLTLRERGERLTGLSSFFTSVLLLVLITAITFIIIFPFSLLDWQGFQNSMAYETGVGRGAPVVFYTRQFIDTYPILFQLQKIFPYALGLPLLLTGTLGFFTLLISFFLNKPKLKLAIGPLLLLLAFLLYFVPNSFLFAKWTRFMAPIFPFFAIFAAWLFSFLWHSFKKTRVLTFLLLTSILTGQIVWTMMFFTIYLRPDVRVTAHKWIQGNTPPHSIFLVEAGNILEVPFNGPFVRNNFDFYSFEEGTPLQKELPLLLTNSDYFVLESRRMFANFQRLPNQFPKSAQFYDLLFSGKLGFEEIKEFNSFPNFSLFTFHLSLNDELAEETWSVFDHPRIRIYKNEKKLAEDDYEKLLGL